ncbi:MAG TPA: hypothetical protein VK447_05780 [Myxococcaceae bacterium]|nr:hypothetical protein [Myxococcaceae bacterium]
MAAAECSVTGCGRKVQAGGLCQTHRKQLRKRGAVRPIRQHRPRRRGTIKLSGVTVSGDGADTLRRYAREDGLTVHAAMTDILEEWALNARESASEEPGHPDGPTLTPSAAPR